VGASDPPSLAEQLEILRRRVDELDARELERARMEDLLRGVAECAGAGVFEALVAGLARALKADVVTVGALVEPGRMRTLAHHSDGALAPGFEYTLQDTPCENVVGRELYICPEDVTGRFPRDAWLVEKGIVSYLGAPLFDRERRPLGNIAVLSRRPAADVPLAESLLRLCAIRASAEIEGARADHELRRAEDELHHAQKMEAIGRLAGGLAHDFNNLLFVMMGHTEVLLRRLPANDPLRGDAEMVRRAGGRATSLTKRLLAFSRREPVELEVLEVLEVLEEMSSMIRRLVGDAVELRIDAAAVVGHVRVDRAAFEHALLNLAINAKDAMPDGGLLSIAVDGHAAPPGLSTSDAAGRCVTLAVSDTGTGMDAATVDRAFEPFFTTKARGKGTGLGLSMVYGFVKHSGGHIQVASEPGRGTTFRISLPRVDGPTG
jgi:signal transduction histidine kinase